MSENEYVAFITVVRSSSEICRHWNLGHTKQQQRAGNVAATMRSLRCVIKLKRQWKLAERVLLLCDGTPLPKLLPLGVRL
jgi:hypothetical protein